MMFNNPTKTIPILYNEVKSLKLKESNMKIKFGVLILISIILLSSKISAGAENESLFPAPQNKKWGYINKHGKMIIKPRFDEASPFSDGLARIATNTRGKTDWMWSRGHINPHGEIVITPQFLRAGHFSEGLAPVSIYQSMNTSNISKSVTVSYTHLRAHET